MANRNVEYAIDNLNGMVVTVRYSRGLKVRMAIALTLFRFGVWLLGGEFVAEEVK